MFSYTLWFGVFPRFQPLEAGASALALTIFVGLFIPLLFRPARSAKTVFVFISLWCFLRGGSALIGLSYPVNAFSSHRPSTSQLYRWLLMSVAVGSIAYFHYRGRQQHEQA
jgi:hypothetical protein